MEREYKVLVDILLAGNSVDTDEMIAIAHFTDSDGKTVTAILPDLDTVSLSEGFYDVEITIYGNSDITIPSTRKVECFEISKGGVLGLFGQTKEKCIDIETPPITLDTVLIGGGKSNTYFLESQLQEGQVNIAASELPFPDSAEQLQYNYEIFDSAGVTFAFI